MALQRYARHFDMTYTLCCSPLSYVHWSHTHSLHKGHIHGGHIQTGHIHLGHIHIVSLSNWQHTLCPHAYCSVSLYKHAHITYTRLTVLFQDTVFVNIFITLSKPATDSIDGCNTRLAALFQDNDFDLKIGSGSGSGGGGN